MFAMHRSTHICMRTNAYIETTIHIRMSFDATQMTWYIPHVQHTHTHTHFFRFNRNCVSHPFQLVKETYSTILSGYCSRLSNSSNGTTRKLIKSNMIFLFVHMLQCHLSRSLIVCHFFFVLVFLFECFVSSWQIHMKSTQEKYLTIRKEKQKKKTVQTQIYTWNGALAHACIP